MNINNTTQFFNFLVMTGLIDSIPNGRLLAACIDEYNYNCNCEKDKNKASIYNRCKALYEDIIRNLNAGTIALIFQRTPELTIVFQERNQLLRTISR